MKLYKVTDETSKTYNDTQWGENVTHSAIGEGKELCTADVIHAYTDPLLAIFFNSVHGRYDPMLLWEAEGDVVVVDGTKVGCKSLTTIKQVPVPVITTEQRVEIAIKCALEVYQEPGFVKWAEAWLSGENRTTNAAHIAADYANSAYADSAYAAANAAYADSAYTTAHHAAYAAAYTAINILKIIKEVVGDSNIKIGE